MTVCKRVISVMMCVAVIIGTMISANLSAKAESGSELMPGTNDDLHLQKKSIRTFQYVRVGICVFM